MRASSDSLSIPEELGRAKFTSSEDFVDVSIHIHTDHQSFKSISFHICLVVALPQVARICFEVIWKVYDMIRFNGLPSQNYLLYFLLLVLLVLHASSAQNKVNASILLHSKLNRLFT